MTDTASTAPTYEQVIAAWNAQADEHNQWDALGEDEKIEWAVACAKAAPPAKREPMTPEQISAMSRKHPAEDLCGWSYRMGIADAEAHYGIKDGDNHGLPT